MRIVLSISIWWPISSLIDKLDLNAPPSGLYVMHYLWMPWEHEKHWLASFKKRNLVVRAAKVIYVSTQRRLANVLCNLVPIQNITYANWPVKDLNKKGGTKICSHAHMRTLAFPLFIGVCRTFWPGL